MCTLVANLFCTFKYCFILAKMQFHVCTGLHSVRLVNGSTLYEGRVEIYRDGAWGSICDTDWDLNDAYVVCRQLGFDDGTTTVRSEFGLVPDVFAMDNVRCTGSEARLQDCTYSLTANCGGWEGAGVRCST